MFNENIQINRSIDLNDHIVITNNSISINSSALPEFNKSAMLSIFNLIYQNPVILIDGEICPSSICSGANYENGTLIFNVSHFTTFSVIEGLYCGDGLCNNNETCTCASDCGVCPQSSSGKKIESINKSQEQVREEKNESLGILSITKEETISPKKEIAMHDECKSIIELSYPTRISFIKDNEINASLRNVGNCKITNINLELSNNIRGAVAFLPSSIESLDPDESLDFKLIGNVKLKNSKNNPITGAVTFVSKTRRIIEGEITIAVNNATTNQAMPLKVELMEEKPDKYIISYSVTLTTIMIAIFIFLFIDKNRRIKEKK
jgi:hypothetical protein